MQRNPAHATYLGIHAQDHRLADLSRAAKLAAIEVERRFLADLQAIDPAELSTANVLEREMSLLASSRTPVRPRGHPQLGATPQRH